jgi:hypothetical protein
MLKRIALAAALSAALATTAMAQGKGPNGGQMVDVEGHPVEFVASADALTFYFSDHDGGPEPTKGATGRAVIQADGKTTIINLAAAEPNLLIGKLQAPIAAGAKIVLTSKIAGHSVNARFETK